MKNTSNSTISIISNETNTNDIDTEGNIEDCIDGSIDIKKLLVELENIGNEKEKEEFIKNYSRIKEKINITDGILLDNNNNNIEVHKLYSIDELFDILETNENKIFDSVVLTINELKSLSDICDLLENKINKETIDIEEIE